MWRLRRTNPVIVEAIGRMWPAHEAASQEIMARFAERLSDEWRQEFVFRVLAEMPWPSVVRA